MALDHTAVVPVLQHLLGAAAAGAVIGFERTYHARPAGFRTHTLVALASSLLMLVTMYQWDWLPGVPLDTVRTDPTRMAQGIMTGIGFLGAGVIFKEGLTVRGLTTAASIWITAAIGILFGVGFYFPAILATVLTVIVLSLFRWLENRIRVQQYAHLHIGFDRESTLEEDKLRELLKEYKLEPHHLTYKLNNSTGQFEYRVIVRTSDSTSFGRLSKYLRDLPDIRGFKLSPTGD